MPLEVTMTTEEKVLLHAQPLTEAGNPATIDGAVQFNVTSGTCTIEANDATSAWCVSGSAVGDSTVTVSCDADLGAGVVPVADLYTVHVVNANAERFTLTADTPVLK